MKRNQTTFKVVAQEKVFSFLRCSPVAHARGDIFLFFPFQPPAQAKDNNAVVQEIYTQTLYNSKTLDSNL